MTAPATEIPYKAREGKVHLVEVPPANFLMVDGRGDPNTAQAYKDAVGALYTLSCALKFALKKNGVEHKVGPLEGLWWVEDLSETAYDELMRRKDEWHWRLMIAQPEAVTPERFEPVREAVRRKKNPTGLDRVRRERFHEGLSAQTLHVGPFAAEGPTVAFLHEAISATGVYHAR